MQPVGCSFSSPNLYDASPFSNTFPFSVRWLVYLFIILLCSFTKLSILTICSLSPLCIFYCLLLHVCMTVYPSIHLCCPCYLNNTFIIIPPPTKNTHTNISLSLSNTHKESCHYWQPKEAQNMCMTMSNQSWQQIKVSGSSGLLGSQIKIFLKEVSSTGLSQSSSDEYFQLPSWCD